MSTSPDPQPNSTRRRTWSDLGPRLASAAVLVGLLVAALYLGGFFFALVVSLAFAGAYREWETMVTRAPLTPTGFVLIGLVAVSGLAYPLVGVLGVIIAIGIACLIALVRRGEEAPWRALGLLIYGGIVLCAMSLRGEDQVGFWAGVFLGTVVWVTDSGAFFAGRQIGGEKLAPDISPSKTWSGALGGLALGTCAGLVIWLWVTDSPWWVGLGLSMLISILGQLGDLCESALKRHFRIKDSGDIIPGHGGLMDRLDSLTFGIVLVVLFGAAHMGFDSIAEGLLFW